LFPSTTLSRSRGEKRRPALRPESEERGRGHRRERQAAGSDAAPLPRRDQRYRDEHAELRLVGEQSGEAAREAGMRAQGYEPEPHEARGQEAVLPMRDVDIDRREGEG